MLVVKTHLGSNGNLVQDSGRKMLDSRIFRFGAFHCKQSNASNCFAFALNFHRFHSSILRLRGFANRAKKGLMGDCTDSQVPPNPGTRPPSPSLSSTSSLFEDERQLVMMGLLSFTKLTNSSLQVASCLSTPSLSIYYTFIINIIRKSRPILELAH